MRHRGKLTRDAYLASGEGLLILPLTALHATSSVLAVDDDTIHAVYDS